MNNMDTKEMVSALADGQLDAGQAASCLAAVARDESAVQAWQSYILIGEVLRSSERGALPPSAAFVRSVTQRLSSEAVTRPPVVDAAVAEPAQVVARQLRAPAANDGVFRWKLVAGLASLAAVAAVGWSVLGLTGTASQASRLAASPAGTSAPVMLAGGERGVMIRDARLDELLAAHQQLGGATALQTPSGFLRNATFDSPAR